LLARLNALLTVGDQPRIVVLCGLGGVGKTSLAAESAHRGLAEVAVAWQIPAEDPAVLAQDMAELAAQLGGRAQADPRDPVASVHAMLAAHPADWLLIFDNAPDESSLRRFLPPAGRGRVIVTSQSQHWPGKSVLDVPVLDLDVAAGFLASRTTDPDQEAANDLALELGGLPLALEQAAAYMTAAGMSTSEYLELYRQRRARLLAKGEAAGHPANVAATLGLALSRLESEAPPAAGLLRLLAHLAPDPVPVTLLLGDADLEHQIDPGVAVVLAPLLGDRLAAGDAISALRRYSLITSVGNGMVLVHRLVQAITVDQVPSDAATAWQQAAAVIIAAAIPADTTLPKAWPTFAVLLPHALTILPATNVDLRRMARFLGDSGSYATARDLFRQIVDGYEKDAAYGPEHPDALTALASLAHWTGQAAGEAAAARDLYTSLLPASERVLGAEHPDTLTARANFAGFTGQAGDAAGARDLYASLLPASERVLGPEHPATLNTLGNLARWTGEAGDTVGARELYASMIPAFERILGAEHLDTLTALANFAGFTGQAGDAAGARDLYAVLLPVRERILGSKHPNTLTTRSNLAHWTERASR